MLKRLLLSAGLGIAVLVVAMPQAVQAQMCNDRCFDLDDNEGNHITFSCISGGAFTNCQATTWTCDLDGCGVSALMLDDGTRVALLPECELDQAAELVKGMRGEVYIDSRYLVADDDL